MEAIQVASNITKLIEAIRSEGGRSAELIQAEAATMRDYDKAMSVASIELKAQGTAVTMIKELSKGACSDLLFDMIVAQKSLKAHWQRLDYLKAQLNGYQSINRHLSDA